MLVKGPQVGHLEHVQQGQRNAAVSLGYEMATRIIITTTTMTRTIYVNRICVFFAGSANSVQMSILALLLPVCLALRSLFHWAPQQRMHVVYITPYCDVIITLRVAWCVTKRTLQFKNLRWGSNTDWNVVVTFALQLFVKISIYSALSVIYFRQIRTSKGVSISYRKVSQLFQPASLGVRMLMSP